MLYGLLLCYTMLREQSGYYNREYETVGPVNGVLHRRDLKIKHPCPLHISG